MRLVIVVLLLCVWLYLAYDALQKGNTGLAVLFLAVGILLTVWRLRRGR
ncbi:MAG TPA: hypothetical protein VNG95_03560 [Gemmatimonadales bacterium]|nr:hypothetical protein [Gemmatimonadales bacterium]